MSNLVGSYWVLNTLPIWATAILLYVFTLGAIFFLRDRFEGLFYNTSYSAMLGDGALLVVVIMATEILKRGGLPPEWAQGGWFHLLAGFGAITLGVTWWMLDAFNKKRSPDCPVQLGDAYHHLVIAPLLCYLGITLLPVIFKNGSRVEIIATISFILLWVVLVVYDALTKRLDQRNYFGLGRNLDAVKDAIDYYKSKRKKS